MDGATVISLSKGCKGLGVPCSRVDCPLQTLTRPQRGPWQCCQRHCASVEPHQLYWHQTRLGVCPQPVRLCVRQTVSRTECTSHSQLLSGLAPKIKEITAVCPHRFIHAMSDYVVMTSCCFDGSHPAVQVDSVHKADNRELYNLFLAMG